MSDALIDLVHTAWREAAAGAPGPRAWRAVRTTCPGPLSVLAAIRENDGAIALLFEAPIENAPVTRARFDADGMTILEDRNYPERVYRIAVTLERRDLDNIFAIVVADLIEAAASRTTIAAAVSAVFARLAAWQTFLRARRTGLGREAVIGLIGELLVLRRVMPLIDASHAVEAWQGPFSGLHDFLRKGSALEVKSGAGSAAAVEITSLDQMDDAGLAALVLVHVHLTETTGGFSLPTLAGQIGDELGRISPPALSGFRDALLASGYADVDADLYLNMMFKPVSLKFYQVSRGFPRLTRAGVPVGVAEARYRLELRDLQPFSVDDATAEGIIRTMGGPL